MTDDIEMISLPSYEEAVSTPQSNPRNSHRFTSYGYFFVCVMLILTYANMYTLIITSIEYANKNPTPIFCENSTHDLNANITSLAMIYCSIIDLLLIVLLTLSYNLHYSESHSTIFAKIIYGVTQLMTCIYVIYKMSVIIVVIKIAVILFDSSTCTIYRFMAILITMEYWIGLLTVPYLGYVLWKYN